jgi:hypothetical protein
MSHPCDHFPPSDVCLMLRVDAERRWLSREVVPVVRQLQHLEDLPEEQLGAALAYLEVTWIEACRLAAETEATFAEMNASAPAGRGETLPFKARDYHTAVRNLREAVERNVRALVSPPVCRHSAAPEHVRGR